jgi:diphosphomevalonate decarboxylase
LTQHRADVVVPQRMAEIEEAIAERDFEKFAKCTIKDSNQFHAVCLDTYPPIFYMNDVSRAVVNMLTKYNKASGEVKVCSRSC